MNWRRYFMLIVLQREFFGGSSHGAKWIFPILLLLCVECRAVHLNGIEKYFSRWCKTGDFIIVIIVIRGSPRDFLSRSSPGLLLLFSVLHVLYNIYVRVSRLHSNDFEMGDDGGDWGQTINVVIRMCRQPAADNDKDHPHMVPRYMELGLLLRYGSTNRAR